MSDSFGADDLQKPTTVFANVDQALVVGKIEQTTSDDEDSTFFDDSRAADFRKAAEVFEAGVQALSGAPLSTPIIGAKRVASAGSWGERGSQVTPVLFTEIIPTQAAARSAFILWGPAGVRR